MPPSVSLDGLSLPLLTPLFKYDADTGMYPIGLLPSPAHQSSPFEVILGCRTARAEDGTSMFVILWEFEVKPGSEPAFENAYGAQGDWVRLFQRDPHFRMTYLLKDTSRPRIYFTMDLWDSEHAYENFKNLYGDAYHALDHACEPLTLGESFIAAFWQSDSTASSL